MSTPTGNFVRPFHPDVIGNAFAQQYYRVLSSSPEHVHKFYHDESILGRPDSDGPLTSITTTYAINQHFLSTDMKGCLIQLDNVDTQPSHGGGVLILVIGSLTMLDTVKHRFVQSFFLAPQENGGYFVLNDVLRAVPEMPLAETNEALVDHVDGNTQIAPFPAEPETSVNESMDPELPSAGNISTNGEVINPSAETIPVDAEVINPSAENISISDEVVEPSVESISSKEKVIDSFGNENSQIKNDAIKIPEVAPTPASAQKDVIKKTYASIVKATNESIPPAPITKPKPKPKPRPNPTVKRAENVEKSSSVPAKTTHAAVTVPPNDQNISDDQGYSIFVKNLPWNATIEMVEAEFSKFGSIKPRGIQVVHRQIDRFCFGFVEFESEKSMNAAIEVFKVRFGSYVSYVEEKRTPKRVVNGVTHSEYNGNARGSRVLPDRGGYHCDNFRGQGAGFVNNGNYRDGDNFRGQGPSFGNNNNYRDGENFRGRGAGFVNNGNNYRDGNNMRNDNRNQNEYSGHGRGPQGNDYRKNDSRQNRNDYRQDGNGYRQNGDDYRQNRDGYRQIGDGFRQNRDGYRQNGDGFRQNRDGYRQNGDDYRQNGNGHHQPRPVHNGNGNANGRPGRFNGPKQIAVTA
ncbi:nuclear transport factor 2-like [Triticum urartu]|uniref:G3BP-like protein n=1 Tax=Triticum urartu TaxID=4572 RepID=A0A8R7PBR0_TRIUA|nr:nuclear transport factor 2-like [Triticum urartu]XP_048555411.1 nuclear transport factor 2-like [Triticum urartu]XP_048555432.1 nuclear transport factor 2-like [Triticum urartu]XP_048555433.1 nuclear transport factor 2-like [Triticum urartu]